VESPDRRIKSQDETAGKQQSHGEHSNTDSKTLTACVSPFSPVSIRTSRKRRQIVRQIRDIGRTAWACIELIGISLWPLVCISLRGKPQPIL
jgi:hypothetical protein